MGYSTVTKAGNAGIIPSYTWATKPSPVFFVGQAFIINVGINGSLWYSYGTKWVHESPINILQSGAGYIVPSLAAANAATYSQSGTTITVTSTGHGIPASVHNGKSIFLWIGSGAAATNWYSNFAQTGANTFTCVSTTSLTTSGGVNTNTSDTMIGPLATTLPGGVMGANGAISIPSSLWSSTGSANTKYFRALLGGYRFLDVSNAVAANTATRLGSEIRNQNQENRQVTHLWGSPTGAGASGGTTYRTIDTSNDIALTISVQLSAANEYIALESLGAELRSAP